MQKLSAIVLVSALLAACGGSSELSSGGSVSIEELPDALGQALCQAEKACNPFLYSVAFSNVDCQSLLSKRLAEASLSQIQAAITSKTVRYDGAIAQRCVSAVSSGACGLLDNHLPDVCRQALAGTVALGGDCEIDSQCSGSSRCQVDGNTCPGTCAPLASAGVACGKDSDCVLGLICSTATSHCTTPAAAGEPCQGGSAAQCSAGLLCVGNDDGQMRAGTCTTTAAALLKGVGESCDLQQGPWCTSGLSCVVESFELKEQKLVATCHAPAAVGGECGFGVPNECPTGQYCPLALTDIAAAHLTANCTALRAQCRAAPRAAKNSRISLTVVDSSANRANTAASSRWASARSKPKRVSVALISATSARRSGSLGGSGRARK
jgi:hypothetical protein